MDVPCELSAVDPSSDQMCIVWNAITSAVPAAMNIADEGRAVLTVCAAELQRRVFSKAWRGQVLSPCFLVCRLVASVVGQVWLL